MQMLFFYYPSFPCVRSGDLQPCAVQVSLFARQRRLAAGVQNLPLLAQQLMLASFVTTSYNGASLESFLPQAHGAHIFLQDPILQRGARGHGQVDVLPGLPCHPYHSEIGEVISEPMASLGLEHARTPSSLDLSFCLGAASQMVCQQKVCCSFLAIVKVASKTRIHRND